MTESEKKIAQKFKQEICDKGIKKKVVAEQLNVSYLTLSKKLDCKVSFTIKECEKMCDILDIKIKNLF